MLLSIRMILNLMGNFTIHSQINDETDLPTLMSVRMAYAPNCLQISTYGNGILCRGNADNRFVLEDISLLEGFEIIQGIFDYYNNWEAHAQKLSAAQKYQELIDSCHLIFRNPISLMDGNYQLVAASSAYSDDDVDEEWKYFKNTGYLSVDTMKRMKLQGQTINAGLMDEPHITPAIGGNQLRMAHIKMYWNNELCGRLSIREKDRPINAADLHVMTILQNIIAPNLAKGHPDTRFTSRDAFAEILSSGHIDPHLLEMNLAYLQWSNTKTFQLLLVRMLPEFTDDMILHQLRRTVLKIFPFCSVNIVEGVLAIILQSTSNAAQLPEILLDKLWLHGKARIGISLPVRSLSKLNHYYSQLIYAMDAAQSGSSPIVRAYDHMISYIIHKQDSSDTCCACHPEVLRLYELDRQENNNYLKLLQVYLDNERNISQTAKDLFMHRNTLVYRMEKLISLLNADLDSAYERNYIRLSIYLLETKQCDQQLQIL